LSCPSECSDWLLDRRCYSRIILLGLAARSALSSVTVSHYWFSDPTLPLAVASAVWFSLDGRCRLRLGKPTINSALRVYLPLEFHPANPSRRVATCQLLSWALAPYSTCEIEGLLFASLPGSLLFRLQGLVTLLAVYSLRSLAGFISHRQRSWDSPFEAFSSQEVSERFRWDAPTYCFAAMITGCKHQADMAAAVSGF
jgi:hypothetical protein